MQRRVFFQKLVTGLATAPALGIALSTIDREDDLPPYLTLELSPTYPGYTPVEIPRSKEYWKIEELPLGGVCVVNTQEIVFPECTRESDDIKKIIVRWGDHLLYEAPLSNVRSFYLHMGTRPCFIPGNLSIPYERISFPNIVNEETLWSCIK